jgi:hypothetical protein
MLQPSVFIYGGGQKNGAIVPGSFKAAIRLLLEQ